MRRFLKVGLLVLAASLGAVGLQNLVPVANAMLWQWSQTASTNATADPQINWSEGQSPSSVNDSARAMMAVTARWRDDISGALVTTGTSSAYAVATNAGNLAATPITGQMIAFRPNATNAAAATLAADGGTAWPIQTAPGVAIGAGTLVSGSPYTVTFSGTAWLLRDFYGDPYQIALGAYLFTSVSTAPNANFAEANGDCVNRTTYAAYFALVGTAFGVCDGTTTFGLPNFKGIIPVGRAPAGSDGVAVQCGVLASGATCGNAQTTLGTSNLPAYTPSGTVPTSPSNAVTPNGISVQSGVDQGNVQVATSVASVSASFTGAAQGGTSTPFSNVPPVRAVTIFVRIF